MVGTPLSNEVEDEVRDELGGVVDCATAIAAKITAKNMTIDETCFSDNFNTKHFHTGRDSFFYRNCPSTSDFILDEVTCPFHPI